MATPSLAMIPSAYADSKVYSVLPNNGDGDFTFNRDSSATRVGQNGLIQEVGFFSSEKVINGDFATDSDWIKGTGWTISGGKANSDGSQTAYSTIKQNGAAPINTNYKLVFTATITSGNILPSVGGSNGQGQISESGTYIFYTIASSGDDGLYFGASSDFVGSIDNVSLKEVLGDQPRLNYDILNGVVQSCPSLLLEGASTNLVTYSEAFDNAYWSKTAASVTSGFISPDGTNNAFKLVEDTATATHMVQRSFSFSNQKYSLSAFIKAGERNWIKINLYDGSSSVYAYFDLTNGVVGQKVGAIGKIENYGNGWYKCSMSSTSNVSSGYGNIGFRLAEFDGGTGYTGNGTSGIYIFGAQLEALSYPTSYIPTNGASQTRAAETCGDAGTASTFNSTEGVLYAEIATNNLATFKNISINDGSNSNRINLFIYNAALSVNFDVGGVNQASLSYTIPDVLSFNKLAFSYKINEFKLFVNGTQRGSTDTSGIVPPINTFNKLSFNDSFGSPFYGNTKDIRVYNEALTDAQLQTLTTL
jgi:hypothetical protein